MIKCCAAYIKQNLRLILIAVSFTIVGIALSAGYGTAVQYTNTLGFCAHTCHEMENTVYQEYTHSKHFKNEFGVVVACSVGRLAGVLFMAD